MRGSLDRKHCEASLRGDSSVGGDVEFGPLIARMGYSQDQLNEILVSRGVYRTTAEAESAASSGSEIDYWIEVVRTPEFQAGFAALPSV